jgi:hypothetical protein
MNENELILVQIEQAFQRKSWHGTNLMGSIRGLKTDIAAFRPEIGRHNIWEIILHCAYWKYSVYRRIAGVPKGSFPLRGSDWFVRPVEESPEELLADIRLLKKCHKDLAGVVGNLEIARLDQTPQGSTTTYRDLIIGVAAHDLYHCGQIQLIKKLYK